MNYKFRTVKNVNVEKKTELISTTQEIRLEYRIRTFKNLQRKEFAKNPDSVDFLGGLPSLIRILNVFKIQSSKKLKNTRKNCVWQP